MLTEEVEEVEEVVNSIEIIATHDCKSKEFKAIIQLYEKQFPVEERKSVQQVENLLSKKIYTLLIARHKYIDSIIGFAFVLFNDQPDFVFLDYMAIDPVYQRYGFGTMLFNSIIEMQKPSSLGVLF